MDLPTHFMFGVAVGLVFHGRVDAALLIGLGALLPDLDREYWFIPQQFYRDEQIHRAGLHNVFVMAFTYLISPMLSLGVFLHVLQDSFTTVKDRGVEWFYPVTRLVKLGLYDGNGNPQPTDPNTHIYFYQEDSKGLVEHADADLQGAPGPVPWRRVYGFAQNGHLLDRGFLFGSTAIILLWFIQPLNATRLTTTINYLLSNLIFWIPAYGSIATLFVAGELDRRDKQHPSLQGIPHLNHVKVALFILGLVGFGFWLGLTRAQIQSNWRIIFADPVSLVVGAIMIVLVATGVIVWQTRGGKKAVV